MNRPIFWTYAGIVLLLVFTLGWVHFHFFHGGYLGYDELEYARLASMVQQGKFNHDSLYAFRYFGFIPLSILYALFGAGDFSNWLITIVYVLIVSGICFWISRPRSFLDYLIMGCVLFFSPLHLLYLEKPMPDIVTELGVILCLGARWSQKQVEEKSRLSVSLVIFLLGSLFIFLSKETFLVL